MRLQRQARGARDRRRRKLRAHARRGRALIATLRGERSLRRAGWVLLGLALALLPWLAALALTLPGTVTSRHWSVTWIGLDVMEAIGLAATGWLVLRRDIRLTMAASATAALLVADAWFDMATAQPKWSYLQAIVLALVVELPLAGFCAWLAHSAPHWFGAEAGSPQRGPA